jgi:hypothetical protein|tara:strand:- start:756 stop:1094 length:339 start_codon:yes stop_codon:yes gene_type:complete
MNNENKVIYDSSISKLLENIKVDYSKFMSNPEMVENFNNGVSVKPGRKFDKVMHGSSVWGFIAKTDGVLKGIPYFVGDVFKAASWRAPAKHVRGTIFSSETNWFSWTGPRYL